MTFSLHRLAICLALVASACSSEAPRSGSPAVGKADDAVCEGAKLDHNGVCRLPNGRFARKECCAVEQDPACFDLETAIQDSSCLDDIDDPADVNWPACIEQAESTMFFAASCCVLDAERFAWCGAIPALECFEFEDFAFDNCVPDDEAPVDWHTCIELSDITQEAAAACCTTGDFLWCQG